ncbi:hypothetical protein NQ176_g11247 [Zarea fungicola]|uniref:Uncharacterized protein n=1 Tax=Zarea fungicola TaxID=93591 RepID=A0ACC1MBA7_9HYPO|nr:hypothetical protein NQ176_g11247 [Lecanicillium fungicola]
MSSKMKTAVGSVVRAIRSTATLTQHRVLVASASDIRPRAKWYSTVLEPNARGIVLRSSEAGRQINTLLSKFWLRDNCRCQSCVNQDTMQRNFDTFQVGFSIPALLQPRKCHSHVQITPEIEPTEIKSKNDGVDITWNDSHQSYYPWSWFYETLTATNSSRPVAQDNKVLWGAGIASKPPEVSFNDVVGAKELTGLADLTSKIVSVVVVLNGQAC